MSNRLIVSEALTEGQKANIYPGDPGFTVCNSRVALVIARKRGVSWPHSKQGAKKNKESGVPVSVPFAVLSQTGGLTPQHTAGPKIEKTACNSLVNVVFWNIKH